MNGRAPTLVGRAALVFAVTAIVLLMAPATAAADPAGPTDYASEIVDVSPPVESVDVSIVGGDSFVMIDVVPGTEVVVLGNRGEHYLLVTADGVVFENQRSPDRFANAERYGADVPASADHTAPPEWRRVGDGGTWAWHDHRAHRMEPFPPLNVERGAVVLDAVVPLLVDGNEVDVRVSSVWMPAPSRVPVVLGLLAGIAVVAAFRRHPGIGLTVVAAAALVVGGVQFRSLPPATDPLWLWWLAPLLALVAAGVATVRSVRSLRSTGTGAAPTGLAGADLYGLGAVLISAVQLLVWWWERRSGLTRAILPTDAPFWLDRLVTAAALSAALTAVVLVAVAVVGVLRTPVPAPVRSRG